jgi:hypothetical protein
MGISPQYTWGEFVEYFKKDDLVQFFTQPQPGGNVFLYRSKDPSVPMEIQEKQPEEKNIVLKRALEF